MKNLLILFALNATLCSAQWQKVYENTGDYLGHRDVFFTSVDTGFVIGNGFNLLSYIITTNDGFETHSVQEFEDQQLRSIYFTSSEVGYIVGVKNSRINVLKTINNGGEWNIINDSVIVGNPLNIQVLFFNDTLGVITLDNMGFKTTDAGVTWSQIISNPAYGAVDADISGSRLAGVGGSQMRYSDDYGVTFNQVTVISGTSCSEIELWDNKFIATGTIFQGTVSPEFPNHNYARIAFGDFPDQNVQTFSFPNLRSFASVERVSNGALYAVAHPTPLAYPYENVFLKSLDGGFTWYGQEILPGNEPNSQLDNLFCVNDTVCYAALSDLVYKTTNGGGPLLDQVEQVVVSIKEIKDDINFSITPNPTSGQVTIRSETELIKEVKVFDLQGKELLRSYPNDFNVLVDLSKYDSGVYLIQIMAGDKIRTGKIVRE